MRRIALGALLVFGLPGLLLAAGLPGEPPGSRPEAELVEDLGADLNEPSDAMLSRQLFGSDKGIAPSDVLGPARRARARLAQATAQRAPGIAAAQWRFDGPTNIGGRVLDIAVDPQLPDTIYVATATGGVWRSSDAGKTFQSAWPTEQTQAIGAIAMTPGGVLFAGTGESGPGGGSLTYGGTGVYRSADRGRTWKQVGLTKSSRISRIAVDPVDEKRIFVAATGPLFKPGGERGLFRSEDGGETWKLVLAGANETTGGTDVAIDPQNPKRIYAAMWDHMRSPSVRRYAGLGSGVFRSDDGGDTWARIGAPFLASSPTLGRIGLSVAPSNPQKLVIVASGATSRQTVYTSANGGDTITTATSPDDPVSIVLQTTDAYGWWFSRTWVDPDTPERVFVAGLSLAKSTNGGSSFTAVGAVHADQHAMAWDPKVPKRVYLGNDGGVYRSDDDGDSWEFALSQPWSQLYGMDVAQDDPRKLVAGLQDNGCNKSWGLEDDQWTSYGCGDGERTLIKPTNSETIYGCSQYGSCFIIRNVSGGSGPEFFDNAVVSARKNWFTPIEFDPENPEIVYTGGEILSRSTDDAATWTPISPDLSNGPGTDPIYSNYGTITTIAPAPMASGTIYVGTDDGNLQVTTDGGTTWTKSTDPDLPTAWITRVEVDPRDPKVAYATYSGFRSGEDAPYLVGTRDGGASWDVLSGDLPRMPLNDVNVIGEDLVVGGDLGVYLSRDRGKTWLKVGKDLPLVPVHELRYHAPSGRLYVATFGRGIFSVDYSEIDKAPVAAPLAPVAKGARTANLGLPRKRAAASCTKLRFKLRGRRLKSVAVFVGSKKAKTLRGRALRRRVTLTLPRRPVTVRLLATRSGGASQLVQTRRYARCRR